MRRNLLFAIPLSLAIGGTALAQPMASPDPMMSPGAMGTSAGGAAGAQATVTLVPENGSNETGMVTLSQTKKGVVVSVVTDTAPDMPQPAHIHKGSCANLDPTPAFPLHMVTKGTDSMGAAKGVSMTTLTGVTLAQLESGQYAVNVHKSVLEAKTYVACGDIKNANPTGTSQ
jgi:hypothetical protein